MGTIDNTVTGALNRVLAHATAARRANGVNWRLAAACRPADPELFFPLSGSGKALEQIAEAKAICAGCPVRRQCLEFALRTRPQGIWGGLTELERHSAAEVIGIDRSARQDQGVVVTSRRLADQQPRIRLAGSPDGRWRCWPPGTGLLSLCGSARRRCP